MRCGVGASLASDNFVVRLMCGKCDKLCLDFMDVEMVCVTYKTQDSVSAQSEREREREREMRQ